MDFQPEFFEALNPGKEPLSYEDRLIDLKIDDLTWIDPSLRARLLGYLEIENKQRLIKGSIKNERITAMELSPIERGDSFMGVDFSLRAIPFLKALLAKGIEAEYDGESVVLKDYPIEVYFEKGKVISIVWTEFPER
ncbi:hypothetical protein [Corynebacterium epidermidicanis]|uniref:Uncharacterized protein n=1 Tax=Corynebacterium epidermidicanis TaxID=1050174 RepID=A0A0G3GRY7_9CORY|nr:hypothetical protein [Corynebacterium epidermidicanis]AKK03956.1 hypothetical protein CEPID_10635 [Corynebacterium epidermidicanis]